MLRMGRSSKIEPTTQEKNLTAPQPTPTSAAPAQQAGLQSPTPQARPVGQESQPSRAVTDAEAMARDIKEGMLSGFVGGGTRVSGDAAFKGMLRIDGYLQGSVTSEKGTLIVSSGGQLDASVAVAVAKINGTVNGDIIASERVEFGRTARVNGNIQTPALSIEQGAVFEGNCRMSRAEATRPAEVKTEVKTSVKATSTPTNSFASSTNKPDANPPAAVAPSKPVEAAQAAS